MTYILAALLGFILGAFVFTQHDIQFLLHYFLGFAYAIKGPEGKTFCFYCDRLLVQNRHGDWVHSKETI